jgi:DNA helicase II / ATP-dependent DNA helicase PcrA
MQDDLFPQHATPPVQSAPTMRVDYLQALNPAQKAAVEALDGPVLVLAGAGTGKTRVLTARLAHIVATRRAWPSRILAVTFTNKASREMRERVGRLIGEVSQGWWMGTFHSLAARMLRQHAELVGLKQNFSILDTDDQLRLLKQLLSAEKIDDKKNPARFVLGAIERWKDKGLTPDKLKPEDGGDLAGGRALAIYAAYQDRLRTLNACDFGDLLLHVIAILQKHPDILAQWQDRFRYILVDEYQDTNVAQYLWLRLLAQKHHNLCCVGDDDQSIYGWRGAEVGNILRFESDFPGAKLIRLEQNYRSTPHILGAAGGLIAHNRGRLGKTLWTETDAGEKVRVRGLWDGPEEARWVGDEIEAFQRAKTPLNEMAVLVRASFQMRAFEERFLHLGLPYRVVGGPRFYERQEIRDAMAYFRLVSQPEDDLAFERIINVPKRGIGPATVAQLHIEARAQGVGLLDATARLVETTTLKPKVRSVLAGLVNDFARWRTMLQTARHTDLARAMLDESGYTGMWQQDKSPEAAGRLDNLKELVAGMEEFDSLAGFLEHVALVMDNEANLSGERITLMTLHAAKGLEFDVVFLPGWEEGVFPHQRAVDETGIAGLEEERRLAYVGLTRARRVALVSHAANRQIHGLWQDCLPSRFLAELPEEHVERSGEAGMSAAMGGGHFNEGGSMFDGGMFRQRESSAFSRFEKARSSASGANSTSRPPPVIDGRAYRVHEPVRTSRFGEGERVFHSKFGPGTVMMVDGDKLDIEFDQAGRKKVIDSFVKPEHEAS